jgi:hypothetical protein
MVVCFVISSGVGQNAAKYINLFVQKFPNQLNIH